MTDKDTGDWTNDFTRVVMGNGGCGVGWSKDGVTLVLSSPGTIHQLVTALCTHYNRPLPAEGTDLYAHAEAELRVTIDREMVGPFVMHMD